MTDSPYRTTINGCTLEVTSDRGWSMETRRGVPNDSTERCFIMATMPGTVPMAIYYGPFVQCLAHLDFLIRFMKATNKG